MHAIWMLVKYSTPRDDYIAGIDMIILCVYGLCRKLVIDIVGSQVGTCLINSEW